MTLPGNIPQQNKSVLDRLVKLEAKVRAVDKKASNGNGGGSSSPSTNPYAGYVTISKGTKPGYYVNITGDANPSGYGPTVVPTISAGSNTVSMSYNTNTSPAVQVGGAMYVTPTASVMETTDPVTGAGKAYVQTGSDGSVYLQGSADSGGAHVHILGSNFWITAGGSQPSQMTSQNGIIEMAANSADPQTAFVQTWSGGSYIYGGGSATPSHVDVAGTTIGAYGGGTNPGAMITDGSVTEITGGGTTPGKVQAATDYALMGGSNGEQLELYSGYIYMKPNTATTALAIDTLGTGTQAYVHPFNESWHNLPLNSGWTAYGSPYAAPQYRLLADGTVQCRGLAKNSATGTTPVAVGGMPRAYLPSSNAQFAVATWSSAAGYGNGVMYLAGYNDATNAGTMKVLTAATTYISFEGLTWSIIP